ncbi:MAG TPA: FAD-linked oxidase C-terminal domain-containing protein [Syntrophorhabdaceae bacterium]|nr:FAD-linked oxidase C-terminal domain-containing protein [Syntrophorhabdaceae bacterium]
MFYEIDRFIKKIKSFLREDQIVLDTDGLSHFSYDATEISHKPHIVVLPESTKEVSKVMRCAYDLDIPVTPQGGRTDLSGGAVPVVGGVVMSLLRMNRILEIDTKNLQIVVEPGVVAADLQTALKKHNLFFPPDPSSTVESTIGGNVAENAGYTRAVKYGVTRDYVLGLEAVLPDGTIINVGGRTVKNVTGYDLVALLTGSEGTLAIITKIICKVLPMPRFRRTCIVYLNDLLGAADFVVSIFDNGIIPCAIELMDNYCINCVADYLSSIELRRDAEALVLVEVDGQHEIATDDEAQKIITLAKKNNSIIESRLASDEVEAERFWRIRRDTLPALKAKGKDHLEADVVVPRYALAFLVQAIKEIEKDHIVKIATFGHAGDGNLHVTIQYRKGNFKETEDAYNVLEEVYKKTIAMSGKLTGEHGVGITVKNYMKLQMTPEEIELLKRIKYAFDPKGILNPRKIFPEYD